MKISLVQIVILQLSKAKVFVWAVQPDVQPAQILQPALNVLILTIRLQMVVDLALLGVKPVQFLGLALFVLPVLIPSTNQHLTA